MQASRGGVKGEGGEILSGARGRELLFKQHITQAKRLAHKLQPLVGDEFKPTLIFVFEVLVKIGNINRPGSDVGKDGRGVNVALMQEVMKVVADTQKILVEYDAEMDAHQRTGKMKRILVSNRMRRTVEQFDLELHNHAWNLEKMLEELLQDKSLAAKVVHCFISDDEGKRFWQRHFGFEVQIILPLFLYLLPPPPPPRLN